MKTQFSGFRCFRCGTEQGADFGGYVCPACGGNLEVRYAWPKGAERRWWIDAERQDVFRYRALLPVSRLPDWAGPAVSALPTGALGEALRAASVGQALGWPVLVAALWCAGMLALAWKVFKWTS